MKTKTVGAWTVARIALGIAACATTSMNSLPSPELGGRTFHNLLVVAAFADLGIRRETEDRFAAADSGGDFKFVPSYQVFFPGRQNPPEENGELLRKSPINRRPGNLTRKRLPGNMTRALERHG